MAERVLVETFLEELEGDFDDAYSMVGAGHPAEYDIRRALCAQRKQYVMGRLRKLLESTAQKWVLLPDAVDPDDKNKIVWRREDWDQVYEDREDYDR